MGKVKAYRIVDWKRRYEVTKKGRAADGNTPVSQLRVGPLDYYRSRVYGHSIGPAFGELLEKAWLFGEVNELAAFGLFHKLMELAADQKRGYRGWILDKDQRPMGAVALAKLLKTTEVKRVQGLLDVLCDSEIRWLELVEFPECSGIARIVPESCGDLYKETEVKGNKTEEDCGSGPTEEEIGLARDSCATEVIGLLKINPNKQSDITTFRDIFEQIELRVWQGISDISVFDAVTEKARDCSKLIPQYRIAGFVKAMQEKEFGYVPKGRRVLTQQEI